MYGTVEELYKLWFQVHIYEENYHWRKAPRRSSFGQNFIHHWGSQINKYL